MTIECIKKLAFCGSGIYNVVLNKLHVAHLREVIHITRSHYLLCSSYLLKTSVKFYYSAGMIIAGYDSRHGGSVYSIPLGGSLHKQSYAIGGSGSTYIYGYCDSYWKDSMTEAEGIEFVKGALKEAIKWDGSSGGVIRLMVLTAKGAVRHLYLPDQDYRGPGTG